MSNFEHMKKKGAQLKVIKIDLALRHWFGKQKEKYTHALETCTDMHDQGMSKSQAGGIANEALKVGP